MRGIGLLFLLPLVAFVAMSCAPAARPVPADPALVQYLLDQTAPGVDWHTVVKPFTPENPPSEDAPLETLQAYWAVHPAQLHSDKVRQRLLAGCLGDPESLCEVLCILPRTPEAAERVKGAYDKFAAAGELKPDSGQTIHDWLMHNSRYFREELVRLAEHGHTLPGYDPPIHIGPEEELRSLARLDWAASEPLIQKCVDGNDQNLSTCARSLQYEHQVKTGQADAAADTRTRLQEIVKNEEFSRELSSRATALNALMATDWDGRDEWFLSLFTDATLMGSLRYGTATQGPLCSVVAANPDRWIPAVAKMLRGWSRAAHDNAVECLVAVNMGEDGLPTRIRPDTIKPLLPWLDDPQWSGAPGRDKLIECLVWPLSRWSTEFSEPPAVELPECVPGMLWVLENDTQEPAAIALGHYRAKGVGPALRKAFAEACTRQGPGMWSDAYAWAMVQCDVLSADEIANGVETCARDLALHPKRIYEGRVDLVLEPPTTQPDVSEDEDALGGGGWGGGVGGGGWGGAPPATAPAVNLDLALGTQLSRLGRTNVAAGEKLLARAKALQQTEPGVAKLLWGVLAKWSGPAIDREVAERLRVGLDGHLAMIALARPEDLRKNVSRELGQIARAGGANGALAAAILGDPDLCGRVLRGTDKSAQEMLPASARLLRTALPVAEVDRLWDKSDERMTVAVEEYLEAANTPESRRLVQAHHPEQILALGPGSEGFYSRAALQQRYGAGWYRKWGQEVLQPGGPDEIFALEGGTQIHSYPACVVVRVHGKTATLTIEGDRGKRLSRDMTPGELTDLRRIVREQNIDDLPGLLQRFGCFPSVPDYVHLTRTAGRRVGMVNPGSDQSLATGWDVVAGMFCRLAKTGHFELSYALQRTIPGARIVLPTDEKVFMTRVWKRGDDLRVLAKAGFSGNDPEAWWSVTDRGDGRPTTAPSTQPTDAVLSSRLHRTSTASHYWTFNYKTNERGIWHDIADDKRELICKGDFGGLLVTPDEKWAVCWEVDRKHQTNGPFVRIELATGKAFPIDAKPATMSFYEGTWLSDHKQALYPLDGNKSCLIDPETGDLRVVPGWFGFLDEYAGGRLQPSTRPGEYWAARHNWEPRAIEIGRYDAKRIAYTKVLTLPDLDAMDFDFWVDESEPAVYFTVNGDLLRAPLPKEP